MALFTLADLHLSFTAEKPMDVFGSRWKDHAARIENGWRGAVAPEDTVVLPGDFSWGMTLEETKADFRFLASLPGKKILLKGNHDYWWSSLSKMRAFLDAEGIGNVSFLQNDAVFAENKILCGSRGWICEDKMTKQDEKILQREALRFALSLKAAKKLREEKEAETGETPEIVAFSHYPLASGGERVNPILPLLASYGVKRLYYGHLHNWEGKPLYEEAEGVRLILVASDHVRFVPQKIE